MLDGQEDVTMAELMVDLRVGDLVGRMAEMMVVL
jgi:hypothetical protein